jgi:hypothetical protein
MRDVATIYMKMHGGRNLKGVSISGLSSYLDRHQHVGISSVQIPNNEVRNVLLNWNYKKPEKREHGNALWCLLELYSYISWQLHFSCKLIKIITF